MCHTTRSTMTQQILTSAVRPLTSVYFIHLGAYSNAPERHTMNGHTGDLDATLCSEQTSFAGKHCCLEHHFCQSHLHLSCGLQHSLAAVSCYHCKWRAKIPSGENQKGPLLLNAVSDYSFSSRIRAPEQLIWSTQNQLRLVYFLKALSSQLQDRQSMT